MFRPMILQSHIPFDLSQRPLPGVLPLDMADWLQVDDAYAGQMAARIAILAERGDAVLQLDRSALPAAQEALALVLAQMAGMPMFRVSAAAVTCPDGRVVSIDRARPLETLCHLIQEDICLMEKRGAEHVLTGACLCFPASWMLAEKFMRPLRAIHTPVAPYDDVMARRVQRLFDGVKAGRPLWRFNLLPYHDPALYQPRSESDRRAPETVDCAPFLRSERQSILRLPETDAVLFSIHTYVVAAPQDK